MKEPNLQARPSPVLWVPAARYLRPGGGTYRRPDTVSTYKRP